jgi:hypothetical protein
MRHARKDYDRIQDPAGLIGKDEPVFLLRAKDVNAPMTLRHWVGLARESGADHVMLEAVGKHAEAMEDWQRKNGSKVADTPRRMLRL